MLERTNPPVLRDNANAREISSEPGGAVKAEAGAFIDCSGDRLSSDSGEDSVGPFG